MNKFLGQFCVNCGSISQTMDSKKANRLLERINALHKSLVAGAESEISGIEKDLMLSYLRQLYEEYQFAGTVAEPATKTKKTTPTKKATPPPVVVETPAPAPPPPAPVVPTPPPAPPAPRVIEKPATSIVQPTPAPAPQKAAFKMNAKVAALFASQEVKELSDRLGQSPIKDLTRALTINNRVQFANVLFSGNSDLMNSVLKRLNGLGSMDAAKPVLAELAGEHDWTDDEKAAVARDFIKLVNRRYA